MSEHGTEPGADRDAQAGSPGTPPQQAAATTPAQPVYGGHAPWAPPQAQQPPAPPNYPGYGGHPLPAPEPAAGPPAQVAPSRRAGRLRIGIAGLVAGALIGGGAGAGVAGLIDDPAATSSTSASAQNVTIKNPETATTATAAAAKAAPSVVTIYVSSGSNSGSGSGVVLTDDGYVLTNNHVVTLEGAGTGAVQVRTADGTLYDATVVGTDPASDLAVVRLDGASGLTPATFANSDKVQVGDVAVAIGAPLGLSNTVTDGIISATGRAVATGSTQDDATVIDALQTDAAINPGNSGGALVNGAGEVVGINSAIATVASGAPGSQSQSGNIGVGFAIPSNTAQRIAKELIANGTATRAFLGVSTQTAADDQNSGVGTGAEIVSVEPDSAAAAAGLQGGDVVTAVGNRPVTTSTELTAAVRSKAPGDTVTLTVRRGNDTRTADVTLGSAS
ncbi:trypsin-like peptidase domain-containing protein [Blastococcus sp. CT_GayMR16]|uniref:S1C family serine protease n=1 Tax=Blastococcus sp. CT_GayMR16 TaxID=2559607 RepID=UPI001073E908|nr:trypsin-like peptidase domain-containing protein [Blastococcus sp. CT_GayMR16]TFV90598.1 PDZ domain-containing protein [Blastococcus sp. CT_GayMR16]